MTFNKLLALFDFLFMPKKLYISLGAGLGLTALSSFMGARGARKGAEATAGAAREATAEQRRQFDITREDLMPWMEAGRGALGAYAGYGRSQVAPGQYIPESDIPQFDPNIDVYQDPGYQFRQAEQERMINRQMGGMGKLMSGNRLEEIMRRSGEMASDEYGRAYARRLGEFGIGREREADIYGRGVGAYGRAYGEESDYLNRLAALSRTGQTTATGLGGLGAGYAGAAGRNIMAAGQAQGAADIGQASAWQSALGDISAMYGRQQPVRQFQYAGY